MLAVAKAGYAGPGETTRLWFDRAVAAQMDYLPAYERYLNSLLPRWGGSHREIYRFGLECLNTKRFDTRVPFQFFECVAAIAGDVENTPEAWREARTRAHLARLFEGYQRAASGADRVRYLSLHAALSAYLEDWDTVQRVFADAGEELDEAAFQRFFDEDPASVRSMVLARAGVHSTELRRAEELAQHKQFAGALAIYENALASSETEAEAVPYLRRRAAGLNWEKQFDAGGWVSLLPEETLTGWIMSEGDWRIEPGPVLVGVEHKGLYATPDADFGTALELRGKVEFASADPGADVRIALRCPADPVRDSVIILIYKDEGEIELDPDFGEQAYFPAVVRPVNTFHVQLWDERVSMSFNGRVVFKEQDAKQYQSGPMRRRVSFGASSDSSQVTLQFSELEVRRLTRPPD